MGNKQKCIFSLVTKHIHMVKIVYVNVVFILFTQDAIAWYSSLLRRILAEDTFIGDERTGLNRSADVDTTTRGASMLDS